jgi:hypothetical protein
MNLRVIAFCFLVSLFTFLSVLAFSPTFVLEMRDARNARLFCAAISGGDDLLYYSINSIYRVPVEERLRVQDDGALVPIEVISTPDVMYYYGITAFTRIDDVTVRAVPQPTRYRELRLKIGPHSQQRLTVRGHVLALPELAAEGESLVVSMNTGARALVCR